MTTFFEVFSYESWLLWVGMGGALYYFILYHGAHRVIRTTAMHKEVTRNMSEARFKQQVRNSAIAPFLIASVVGSVMAFNSGTAVPLLRFQGLVTGCYVFEVLELLWGQRYALATHHIVACGLYTVCWLYGEVPEWVSLNKVSLFLGSTFFADVAHHLSGLLIHFVGREKRFVRYFLLFSACAYAGRMACALYCGIYAFLFLKGVFGWMLVTIAVFCLTVDRFLWFPNILRAYGLRSAAATTLTPTTTMQQKPTFVMPNMTTRVQMVKQD